VQIPNRLVLAPMAGVTNSAYRRLLKRHGVGLVVTEMVSAYGILYANARTAAYLVFAEEERPLAVQLFGDQPRVVAEAARAVLARTPRPDLIDLNLGCPVRKVLKGGAGCALAAAPQAAAAVARAVVEVCGTESVPVTAKIRSGPDAHRRNAVELALRLQEAGVAAIAVHPRTAEQKYSGQADHEITAAVVQAASVPVLASGDVTGPAEGYRILEQTGATGLMLARGAQGNPWLADQLLQGVDCPRPPLPVVISELRSLLAMAVGDMGERRAARWIRSPLTWFLRPLGVPGRVLEELRRCESPEDLDIRLGNLTG
jgi:tRNA-dihydrouridine synthase B